MKLRDFLIEEYGALAVDWMVLSAALVGLGIASVAAVSNGVTVLGKTVEDTLCDAEVSGRRADCFEFTWHSAEQREALVGHYRGRTDAQLRYASSTLSARFRNALRHNMLDTAQRRIEERHVHQKVLEERGVSAASGALSVADMQQMLAEAREN